MFKALSSDSALKTSKPTPGQRHVVMCTVTKTHEDFYCVEKIAVEDCGKDNIAVYTRIWDYKEIHHRVVCDGAIRRQTGT